MKRHLTVLAGVAFLAGCSSSVDLVSSGDLSRFTPGRTNEIEVVGELGKPLETITEADGTKIEQYAYSAGATGGSIVPEFLGGSGASSYRMVSFVYEKGGTLKEIRGAGDLASK